MPAAEPKIELREVSLALDGKAVLEQLSLHIPADGVTCLTGPSGCGKTTLLRLIAGLIRPDAGEITGVPDRPSFLFQEDRLIPWLTARGNVRAVLPPSGGAQADRLLREVGLDADADSYPDALSGGMRRRVALARALAYGGGRLLLDEPFKGLDPELMERLAALILRQNRPVLVSSHAEREMALLGGRTLRFSGPPLALLE